MCSHVFEDEIGGLEEDDEGGVLSELGAVVGVDNALRGSCDSFGVGRGGDGAVRYVSRR